MLSVAVFICTSHLDQMRRYGWMQNNTEYTFSKTYRKYGKVRGSVIEKSCRGKWGTCMDTGLCDLFIVYCVCFGLSSCVFFCVVWFCLVTWYIFHVRGMVFPKDQIEESFIVMVYYMYSQHVTLSIFSLISLFSFNCNILFKGTI